MEIAGDISLGQRDNARYSNQFCSFVNKSGRLLYQQPCEADSHPHSELLRFRRVIATKPVQPVRQVQKAGKAKLSGVHDRETSRRSKVGSESQASGFHQHAIIHVRRKRQKEAIAREEAGLRKYLVSRIRKQMDQCGERGSQICGRSTGVRVLTNTLTNTWNVHQ